MAGLDNIIKWVVILGVAYIVVTKTSIIQNFTSKLQGLGGGGGGGQTANAQPDNSGASSQAPATAPAPAASAPQTVPAPVARTVPTVTTVGQNAAKVVPTVVAHPANARNKVPKKAVAPRANNAPAAGGALTTGSGQSLKSTLTNAQMLAMGISSAGCPSGGQSSGGRHCYTTPGRHHCCPGKPSPPGSPSNAQGQSVCECDA